MNTKQTNKYQTKEQNTQAKRLSEIKEHLNKAVIIGLSNFFNVDMDIKVPQTKDGKSPESLHNLIVEKASICSELESPSLGPNRTEKRNRANKIFNKMSEFVCQTITGIVYQMTGNVSSLNFTTAKARATTQTEKMMIYNSFEPLNEKGMEIFGKKVIEIVTEKIEKVYVDKQHAIVHLDGCNGEIVNAFYEVMNEGGYMTENAVVILNYFNMQIQLNEQQNQVTETYTSYSNCTNECYNACNTNESLQTQTEINNQNEMTEMTQEMYYNYCDPNQMMYTQIWVDPSTGISYQVMSYNTTQF